MASDQLSFDGLAGIVTGGGRGIGRAIALGLARAGALVAVVGRNTSRLDEVVAQITAAGGRGIACQADITDEDAVAEAVDATLATFGRVDILVNNAGSAVNYGRAEKLSLAGWEETVRVNLTGAFLFSRAVAVPMAATGGGSIVMISSIDGLVGVPRMAAYSAAKAGVIGLTRALAAEWAERGIRVNCICPGGFKTDMTASSLEDPSRGAAALVLERTPQHRYASPEEVVSAVLYFASPSSAFTSGAILPVDGGYTAV